jgi:hypothetical protein
MADDHPQREGLSKTLLAVLALVPAIATAITGFLAWRVSSEVESVKAELQQIESQRAFDLEIYKAVKEALAGSAKDQQVALALVVSIGQEPLRSALLGTLEEAPTAAPEIVAQARSYRMPEKAAASQPQGSAAGAPAWADWDFDLFYCEASPAWAKSQADELASAMVADGAKGRIRVRPLSAGKNQESAYRINGYALNRSDDESAMADKLAAFARSALPNGGISFDVKRTSQRSPWYISAFLCPESGV